MNQALLQKVTGDFRQKKVPYFNVGDQVIVSIKIKEGDKERIQNFEGMVISLQRVNSIGANFTVRKIASGIGVERTFPIYSPLVEKIKVKRHGKTRRAKLYYIRGLSEKNTRLKRDLRKEAWSKTSQGEVKDKVEIKEKKVLSAQEELLQPVANTPIEQVTEKKSVKKSTKASKKKA